MAGPSAQSGSLQDRLLRLGQTLQFAWFVGHVFMIFNTLRYGLFYITLKTSARWGRFSYRLAFASALVTYGIVVYKGYRARVRQGKPTGVLAMLQDENVQYLLMASIWLWSRQIPLALLPFVVYSIFHVATYVRSNIIPTISPTPTATAPGAKVAPKGALAESIGKFIKEYYDSSMLLVAVLEIALWFRVLGSALVLQKGSWILLVAYTVFFRARFSQSSFVQGAIADLGARGDALLANQSTDPNVRQAWEQAKKLAHQAVEATDLSKYIGKGQAGPATAKKAQ